MGFDEENNDEGHERKKSRTFFGLEISDGVTYTIVIILTLIFIRHYKPAASSLAQIPANMNWFN